MTNEQIVTEVVKAGGDVISLGTLIGYFTGVLPVIATILTIAWTALRIWEMCTVQRWFGKDKKDGSDKTS